MVFHTTGKLKKRCLNVKAMLLDDKKTKKKKFQNLKKKYEKKGSG
jgi:hypothetical protein